MFDDDDLVYVSADKLKTYRDAKGWTQQRLVDKASEAVKRRTLQHMEGVLKNGRRLPTKYINVQCAAEALGVNPDDLIDLDGAVRQLRAEYFGSLIEPSPIKAQKLLTQVSKDAKVLLRGSNAFGLAQLRAKALSRLAELATDFKTRLAYRQDAIKTLRHAFDKQNDCSDLVALANRVVDFFYDSLQSEASQWLLTHVRETNEFIISEGKALEENLPDTTGLLIALMTQSSSLLRCQSQLIQDRTARTKKLDTMLRCAEKALTLDPDNPTAQLEYGQATCYRAFGLPREEYDSKIRIAEEYFRRSADSGWNVANLACARFFRQTYRQFEAIAAFREYVRREKDRRRTLCETHIAGESAWQLWRQRGTEVIDDVVFARDLLSESVAAGYCDVRKIAALAFLEAILNGVESALAVLATLSVKHDVSWKDLIETAVSYVENGDMDRLRRAFRFGLDQGANWNNLGTFAMEFLHERELAIRFYEAGLKLSPNNAALWLNKARVLKELGRVSEAASCLRNASQHSNAAFRKFVEEVRSTLQ